MILRDGQYYQRRWQIGFGGKGVNVEEMRIDYVLGSGNHARSYLHRTPRGTLIELPLGWYSARPARARSGHWGMSPGSDSDHPRTRRFVSYKCMFCHNGIPQIPAGQRGSGQRSRIRGRPSRRASTASAVMAPAASTSEPSGTRRRTAGRHAREHRQSGPPEFETPHGNLHAVPSGDLQRTDSGSLMRFDRGPFSFMPGEPLEAFMLTFDHAPGTGHDDKFEAVSSVYRLRQSQCFLRRAKASLTCETCHNPHRVPRGAEAVAHYSAVCRQCHSTGRARSQPSKRSSRPESTPAPPIAHAATCRSAAPRIRRGMVMTDHLIQRRPPAGDLLAEFRERPPEEYHGEVVPYYPSPLPQTAENALYRAVAQVGLGQQSRTAGLPLLAREIARQKPARGRVLHRARGCLAERPASTPKRLRPTRRRCA